MKKYILFVLFGLLILSACSGQTDTSYTEESADVETDDTCPPSDQEFTFAYGEGTYIGDYTVTVQDITLGSADVDVDGSSTYVGTGSSSQINGLEVTVVSTDVQEPIELSTAILTFYC